MTILPCPFCGNERPRVGPNRRGGFYVYCPTRGKLGWCGAQSRPDPTFEGAVANWIEYTKWNTGPAEATP